MALPILDQETRALAQVGFFRPLDFVMLGGATFYLVTFVYWCIFTAPPAINVMVVLFFLLLWMSFWIVLLLFRACRFIVEVRAAIATLPYDSARALSTYFTEGGAASENVKTNP